MSEFLPTISSSSEEVGLAVLRAHLLTPPNNPIAPPLWLGTDYKPNWAVLTQETPKDYRRVAVDKSGKLLYRYAPVAWFTKVANECWGVGNWGVELIREEASMPTPDGNFEYTVILQFVAPCIFRPVVGIGSSTFYANNPQESMAKTRNAAMTSAFKAALRQGFGVARDIEEDDPEIAKVVENRSSAIVLVYKRLCSTDRAEEAKGIIRRYAPTALLDNGDLLVSTIEFERLEPIQRELQALIIASKE